MNGMRSLSKRLARLEAGIVRNAALPGFPSFGDQFAAIERYMVPKLSVADRDLWQKGIAVKCEDPAWNRLNDAFNLAAVEARVPFALCIEDRWGRW
jgi:hypothetical protein